MKHFLFTIIVFSSLFIFSCSETKLKPKTNDTVNSDELPDQQSIDAVINFSEAGKKKAILYSDVITVLEEKKEKLLDGVKILFFNEEEEQTSTLTADKGKIDDATQDMYAINNVVAVSDSGVTLETDELIWKNKSRKIVTDKFVKITSKEEIIEGYGFESDQNLNNYTIFDITYVTTLAQDETE